MKITNITRSFSAKKQIKQFEPIEVFASYTAEVDEKDKLYGEANRKFKRIISPKRPYRYEERIRLRNVVNPQRKARTD